MSSPQVILRHEIRAVVRLATPIALGQVGMMLMGVVDTMMLGRLSAEALAAGALGHGLMSGLVIFPLGVLLALGPLVAQAYGAEDHHKVAVRCQQGLVVTLALCVPLSALMWWNEGLLRVTGQDPHIAALATLYLRSVVPGGIFFLLFLAVRQVLEAMSIVRPALLAIVAANLLNVLANYALIFGKFGFPALGVLGSGLATSISRAVMFLILLLAALPALRPLLQRTAGVWKLRGFRRMLVIGVPSGIQLTLELWLFVAVTLMMGNLGAHELAAHQIVLNLASLTFMVPLGISGAAVTRVGNALGRGSVEEALRSAKICLGLGAVVMAIFGLIFWFFPESLGRLYTPDPRVIALAATLLPAAAVFQVFDGLQVVSVGSLRGTADTRMPALIALIGFWIIGLPLGWWLARPMGLGAPGLWWGVTSGLFLVAILLLLRVRARFARPLEELVVPPEDLETA